jgi:hypothetical protein
MPKHRRRSFTPQFKAQIVLEGLETLFQGGEQRDPDQDRTAECAIRVRLRTARLRFRFLQSAPLPGTRNTLGHSYRRATMGSDREPFHAG